MTTWQTEIMEENARNQMWEGLNAPDQYEAVLVSASKELEKALASLDTALDRMYDASAELSETPMQDKTESFIDELLSIKAELDTIRGHWERGERE